MALVVTLLKETLFLVVLMENCAVGQPRRFLGLLGRAGNCEGFLELLPSRAIKREKRSGL